MKHITLEGNTVTEITDVVGCPGVSIAAAENQLVIGPEIAPAPQEGWPYNTESFWRWVEGQPATTAWRKLMESKFS